MAVASKPPVKAKKTTSNGTSKTYDKKTYQLWYETMVRVRKFEERALMAYSQQKIRGFCHVYIGQEAITAGLVSALRPVDNVVTAYRQHGIALSRGLSARSCMAELFGKSTGCVGGKGGSMHFFSKEHHYFGGNGIVGAQIPIGTGIALAEKYRKTDNVTVCMFGDGAARQGALHESFNMAMTWKLPVLYICENNGYAMGTSVKRTSNVLDLYKLGEAYDMPSLAIDGMSPIAVHEGLMEACEHIRKGNGPFYLEIKTYRYRGHSVSDPAKYRTKDELEHYKKLDPISMLADLVTKQKIVSSKELKAIDEAIIEEIDDATEFAENSPLPDASALYLDNYMQEDYPYIRD